MTDTTTNEAVGADTGKRESVAKHEFLSADGSVAKRMEEATGIRYTVRANGQTFEWQSGGKAGDAVTMLALFGAKTKATNEASRVRQGNGTADEQLEAIDEVFDNITKGTWRERAEGTGKTRTDLDKLAQAIAEAKGETGGDSLAAYRAKLEEETYVRKARAVAQVKVIYDRLMGTGGKLEAL